MQHHVLCREQRFRLTMATAQKMLRAGLLTEAEYHEFEREMTRKYDPPIAGLTVKSA